MGKLRTAFDLACILLTRPRLLIECRYGTPLENYRFPRAVQLYKEGENVLIKLLLEELLEKLTLSEPKKIVLKAIHEGKRGSLSPYELKILTTIVKASNAKNILEIGTFEGRTSLNIASNMNNNARLYTMDLPQEICTDFIVGNIYKNSEVKDKIVQIHSNSKHFDFSKLPNMDLIFIDGGHSYEEVLSDTKNAINILKKNGIIIWDDIDNCHLGPTEAVYSLSKKNNFDFYLISGTKMAIAFRHKK